MQLQRAMAAEAEAAREARAKVIAAEGEQKASHALKEAAAVIQESPSALQVIFDGSICIGGKYIHITNQALVEYITQIYFSYVTYKR